MAADLGRSGANEFTRTVERRKHNFNPGNNLPLWERRRALESLTVVNTPDGGFFLKVSFAL